MNNTTTAQLAAEKVIVNAPERIFLTFNEYGSVADGWHRAESPIATHERVVWYIKSHCRYCDQGMAAMVLDNDGTLTSITGEPGTLCHASDDGWWPCANADIVNQSAAFDAVVKSAQVFAECGYQKSYSGAHMGTVPANCGVCNGCRLRAALAQAAKLKGAA